MTDVNHSFIELDYCTELTTNGGSDWPGADFIYAIFNCGKELGKALRHAKW